MNSFIDTFIEEFDKYRIKFYTGRVVEKQLKIINNIEDIISVDDIDEYLSFLNELPFESHINISHEIWKYLFGLSIITDYQAFNNKYISKNKNKIPSKQINDDIKKIQKFKEVAHKVFSSSSIYNKGKNIVGMSLDQSINRFVRLEYSSNNDLSNTKEYNIEDFFEIIDLILEDFNSKKWKFISENCYNNEKDLITKEDFKIYLHSLCKKYKIKHTDNIRNLFHNVLKDNF